MLVAIPFYRNEDLVDQVLASLIACKAELQALQAEVILFNDSPDYAPLGEALERAMASAGDAFPCRLVSNAANHGFVRTMNVAMAEAVARRRDIVLLNSDTLLFPGALSEMARIAERDPRIAFVNPRSNNATLATLPHRPRPGATPDAAFAAAQKLAAYLPEFSDVPTAVGFCMLIRWKVLADLGLFDEIYGLGYNEENDLVMRAGRHGYRAVLANRAFVWHQGEQSFGDSASPRSKLDARNHRILVSRYPDYPSLTEGYFRSAEYLAEGALGGLAGGDDDKLDVAIYVSNARGQHHAEAILAEATRTCRDRFNLYILSAESARGPEAYAAIVSIGAPTQWRAIERMVAKAASFGVWLPPDRQPEGHAFNEFAIVQADLRASDDLRADLERAIANVTYAGLVARIRAAQAKTRAQSTSLGRSTERLAARLLRIHAIRASARWMARLARGAARRLRRTGAGGKLS